MAMTCRCLGLLTSSGQRDFRMVFRCWSEIYSAEQNMRQLRPRQGQMACRCPGSIDQQRQSHHFHYFPCMIPDIRADYNAAFTPERYQAFLNDLYAQFDHIPGFRIAETPVFIPAELREKIFEA